MGFGDSTFRAWQEVERRLVEAEHRLSDKLCSRGGTATPDEFGQLHELRTQANTLTRQMLAEMRDLAASLKYSDKGSAWD